MEKESKKSSGGAILITAIILLVLFGGCLFILNKQGYLSFEKNDTEFNSNTNNNLDNNTNNTNNTSNSNQDNNTNNTSNSNQDNTNNNNNTIMSYGEDEEIDMLNSILGVWANIERSDADGMCYGMVFRAFEDYYINIVSSKLNSEPSRYLYISYKKIAKNKFELDLVQPFLSVEARGYTNKFIIDTSKINDKILIVGNTEYKYVGEAGTDICDWYRNNH